MSNENELTSAERELETALRSLRPTPARINPTAATHAAGRRGTPMRLLFWQTAAAAAIAIAGGAWLVLSLHEQAPDHAEHLATAIELPADPRMLIVYRRALAQSPAELDALLDRQGRTGLAPDAQFTPVGVSPLWNAALQSSLGEM